MCDACDTIISDMSPKAARQSLGLFSAMLLHFIDKNGAASKWNSVKLYAALEKYIDTPQLREMLPTSEPSQKMFMYGGMTALDMVLSTFENASAKVQRELNADLAIIAEAIQ